MSVQPVLSIESDDGIQATPFDAEVGPIRPVDASAIIDKALSQICIGFEVGLESEVCLQNGEGTVQFESGDVYEGQWKDGKRHGIGSMYLKDGSKAFTADWRDDRRIDLDEEEEDEESK